MPENVDLTLLGQHVTELRDGQKRTDETLAAIARRLDRMSQQLDQIDAEFRFIADKLTDVRAELGLLNARVRVIEEPSPQP